MFYRRIDHCRADGIVGRHALTMFALRRGICYTYIATLHCAGLPTLAAGVFKQYITPCPLRLAASIKRDPSAYHHMCAFPHHLGPQN
jgi:hypothetical protein